MLLSRHLTLNFESKCKLVYNLSKYYDSLKIIRFFKSFNNISEFKQEVSRFTFEDNYKILKQIFEKMLKFLLDRLRIIPRSFNSSIQYFELTTKYYENDYNLILFKSVFIDCSQFVKTFHMLIKILVFVSLTKFEFKCYENWVA